METKIMWMWCKNDGEPYHYSPTGTSPRKCPICGQYFKKGEKGCVIVPPMEIRKNYKGLSQNLKVHYSEWVDLCRDVSDDEALAIKFSHRKKIKQKPFTTEESTAIDAFVKACWELGFRKEIKKPYGMKMQKVGTSLCLEYNVFADTITLDRKGKRGLFDGFFERQIVADASNKMHAILGDGKHNDYNYKEEIRQVQEEVQKWLK